MKLNYLKVKVLGQTTQVLGLLGYDTHVWQHVDGSFAEAQNTAKHQDLADDTLAATSRSKVDQVGLSFYDFWAHRQTLRLPLE